MDYEGSQERIQISALERSAHSMRRSMEICNEQNELLRHALSAYRELLNDDVSDHVAELVTAINRKFNQINHAYDNAARQLTVAAELLAEYEQLGN